MAYNDDVSEEVIAVANEIANYLDQNENTADTIEGIANWWLMRQRLQEEKKRVEIAVEYLCRQGRIEKRMLSDGRVLYYGAKKKPMSWSSLAVVLNQTPIEIQ